MNKLYYVEYIVSGAIGSIYCLDTGFGILELGTMEDGKVWEESNFFRNVDLETFLERYMYVDDYQFVRVS